MTNTEFGLLGNEEVRKNDRKFWLIFIFLLFVTYWSFKIPISMMIAFALVVVTMLTFIVYFANRNSKPTHIKIDGSMISARRYKRQLWSVKISELAYEAIMYDDELRRTFYLYDNGLLRGRFSFINYEMTQYKVFLELIANYLKKDVNLFYQETFGREIPIRSLSEKFLSDSNPKSSTKHSLVYILFRSLFSVITTKNPKHESLGIYKKSVQYARVIFWLTFIFALVQGWFLLMYERPFNLTPYQEMERCFIDSGKLSEVHQRKTPTSLMLVTDSGKQIRLDYTYPIHKFLGGEKPKQLEAKIWWFPLKDSNFGWISKMEINDTEVISVEEQKEIFQQRIEYYFRELYSISFFLLIAFLAWMWEFRIQYSVNRQLAS
ncbi:hypothetical protein [Sulfuricurvum sp.]|uniref:hypothetical protein n=1 Tax=Sulfuricurvum sp. TaxID=2025608 RepID=UPI002D2BE4E2|nr:hypothetical protein [Sulfuricurvum sp.]HZF69991.1 hypothetical protein [Sulfuricurvum sp.]